VLFSRKAEEFYGDPGVLRRLKDRDSKTQEQVWRLERSRLRAIARSVLKSGEDLLPGEVDRIDRSIWARWLTECLAGLGEKARRVLRMHYGHEMSYAFIAGELGGSRQAVGKMAKKSLQALRRCLQKHRAAVLEE
jgi:RNA polymerase sigma factor (sigma-70 family)